MHFNLPCCCDSLFCAKSLKLRLPTEKHNFGAIQASLRLAHKEQADIWNASLSNPRWSSHPYLCILGAVSVPDPECTFALCPSLSCDALPPFYLWHAWVSQGSGQMPPSASFQDGQCVLYESGGKMDTDNPSSAVGGSIQYLKMLCCTWCPVRAKMRKKPKAWQDKCLWFPHWFTGFLI